MSRSVDVTSSARIREAIARVRATTPGSLTTNLFLSDSEIESLAARDGLMLAQQTRAALIFAKDGPLTRLYFVASGPEDLGEALMYMPAADQRLVCDVIGREAVLAQCAIPLAGAGFTRKRRYLRMSRFTATNHARSAGDLIEYPEVEHAVESDAPLILGELTSEFDPDTDHIPSLDRIRRSIAAGTVLIVRDVSPGSIPGIGVVCYWDRTGKATAVSRYWFVRPHLRRSSAGLRAWTRFLQETADCHRLLLWVREENAPAIGIYKFYGFAFDLAMDDVFVKD